MNYCTYSLIAIFVFYDVFAVFNLSVSVILAVGKPILTPLCGTSVGFTWQTQWNADDLLWCHGCSTSLVLCLLHMYLLPTDMPPCCGMSVGATWQI